MGFFSGISKAVKGVFGGGSSQSSSQSNSVQNKNEINIDLSALADSNDNLATAYNELNETQKQALIQSHSFNMEQIFNSKEQLKLNASLVEQALKDGVSKEEREKLLIKIQNEQNQKADKKTNITIFLTFIGFAIAIFGIIKTTKKKRGKK